MLETFGDIFHESKPVLLDFRGFEKKRDLG